MYSGPESSTDAPSATRRDVVPEAPKTQVESSSASANGRTATDFVSEDDVKRAIQKGQKIYVNARTIITPAARDIGEPAEVFAKV
jgi:hypothetical protein